MVHSRSSRCVRLWRITSHTLLAALLGVLTTAGVATALANSRTWRDNTSAAAYKQMPFDGEVFRIRETTSFVALRQVSRPGMCVSLVNELADAKANADGSLVDYVGPDFSQRSVALSNTTLSARFRPSAYKSANAMQAFTYGWPAPAMGVRSFDSFEGCYLTNHGCTNWLAIVPRPNTAVSGYFSGSSPHNTWGIPTDIDPRGFAFNTAVYGGSWLATLSLVGIVRNRRARKHNTCKHCNYSRNGLAAGALCPECGQPA